MERIGSLFTNEQHHIIFIDDLLKQFLGYTNKQFSQLIGEHVTKILNYDSSTYETVAREILQTQRSNQIPMKLILVEDIQQHVIADAIANRKDKSFMGIDYIFYADATVIEHRVMSPPREMAKELVRLYCQGQINSLIQFLRMMGGEQMETYILAMLQATSETQNWNMTIENHQVKLATSDAVATYVGSLKKATAYSYKLLGKSVIMSNIEQQNAQYHSGTFDYIATDWYQRI